MENLVRGVEVGGREGRRTVHCADAAAWLEAQGILSGCSVVTSLPDVSEMPGLSTEAYERWFVGSAARVLAACPPDGVAIFYQTDVKPKGRYIDKGYLAAKAAEQTGARTLWHRIVLRAAPGTPGSGRATYSHLLCFSRGPTPSAPPTRIADVVPLGPQAAPNPRRSCDVLPAAGKSSWTRGMGEDACRAACRFVLDATETRTVVDPYCGRGTVLAVANSMGLDAVGVEICRKRARQARALRIGT